VEGKLAPLGPSVKKRRANTRVIEGDQNMDCCGLGSICFEWMKGLPAAFVALIIGCIAGGIAYRQYQVAEAKLKLDLFQQRYKIFLITWRILSSVISDGTRKRHYGLGTPFNNFIPKAKFLFGADVESYLNDLATKWARLHAIEGIDTPSKYAEEKFELTGWFQEQADTGVKAIFGRYLNFERWK